MESQFKVEDCAILILTCDSYLQVIGENLKFMEKFWSDCPFNIFIGAEKETINYNGNLKITTLQSKELYWSNRVIDYIHQVNRPYLLISLDDFFIEENVDNRLVIAALDILRNRTDIANICFSHISEQYDSRFAIDRYACRFNQSLSTFNWQMGLWRVSSMLENMKKKENPWQSEQYGAIRANIYSKQKFYCASSDSLMPIKYGKGWLIVRGKWNKKEIDRIEEKCNITINVGNRRVESIDTVKESSVFEWFSIRMKLVCYYLYVKCLSYLNI